MTKKQAYVAHALAEAHGHSWARYRKDQLEIEDIEASIPCTANCSVPGDHDGCCARAGILAPALDDAGVILHTTGTGRMEWTVGPDAAVEIWIYRPGAVTVAHAVVTSTGEVTIQTGEGCLLRHAEALCLAVAVATAALQAYEPEAVRRY
jgi:hypothetical protein